MKMINFMKILFDEIIFYYSEIVLKVFFINIQKNLPQNINPENEMMKW